MRIKVERKEHSYSPPRPKNEKSNLSKKELNVFKELSRILFGLSAEEIAIAIENGDFIEVKS